MTRTVTVAWGLNGLERASPDAPTCIVVDVLSFSTAVVTGCSQGASIYPFLWKDDRANAFAQSIGAQLAVQRQDKHALGGISPPSLSPVSLTKLEQGDKLVLPSPNGSTLSFQSSADRTIAGCLRNASAVARYVSTLEGDVAVVAAGERWPDGTLRVALEDLIGAGAIVAKLGLLKDVEASAAQAVFHPFSNRLESVIQSTTSGRELIDRGYEEDVIFASDLDASDTVPMLVDDSFRKVSLAS